MIFAKDNQKKHLLLDLYDRLLKMMLGVLMVFIALFLVSVLFGNTLYEAIVSFLFADLPKSMLM